MILLRNLKENKKQLIKDVDYFFVKPVDVQKYEIRTSEINNRGTYLITESSYLMLVKPLQDDLAWKVQRELVNNYFRTKEVVSNKKLFNEFKGQLTTLVNDIFEGKLSVVKEYYKIKSKSKTDISNYIKKRLGILKADDEYKKVKARVFLILGITKWEDLGIDNYKLVLPVIDESIRIIKLDRPQQIRLWD